MVLVCCVLPTWAWAEPISYNFTGNLPAGTNGGTIVGHFTIDPTAASIGNSTIRDGGQLFPVFNSSFTITPNYGDLPTATGSATSYCVGRCIFSAEPTTTLQVQAGQYVARLSFDSAFTTFRPQLSDLSIFQPGASLPSGLILIPSGSIQQTSVPEPEHLVWLVVVGLVVVVPLVGARPSQRVGR
jgi:hypothetical protein